MAGWISMQTFMAEKVKRGIPPDKAEKIVLKR
jgi:hypothetical protein